MDTQLDTDRTIAAPQRGATVADLPQSLSELDRTTELPARRTPRRLQVPAWYDRLARHPGAPRASWLITGCCALVSATALATLLIGQPPAGDASDTTTASPTPDPGYTTVYAAPARPERPQPDPTRPTDPTPTPNTTPAPEPRQAPAQAPPQTPESTGPTAPDTEQTAPPTEPEQPAPDPTDEGEDGETHTSPAQPEPGPSTEPDDPDGGTGTTSD